MRYEVLRRDGHACRYCGAKAPEAAMTVDHVIPVALGGKHDPSNLVACCVDCNAGKASSGPDEPLVADVSEHAQRWADAIQRVAREMADDSYGRVEIGEFFDEAWRSAGCAPRPRGWFQSVLTFSNSGLPFEVMGEMVLVANSAPVARDQVWRYFCGCCWNKVRELQERAVALVVAP